MCARVSSLPLDATSIVIGESIRSVPKRAFALCALEHVFLPPTLAWIGDFAFKGCSSLDSVDLPAALVFLGRSAFEKCTAIADVSFPPALETIGESPEHC